MIILSAVQLCFMEDATGERLSHRHQGVHLRGADMPVHRCGTIASYDTSAARGASRQ